MGNISMSDTVRKNVDGQTSYPNNTVLASLLEEQNGDRLTKTADKIHNNSDNNLYYTRESPSNKPDGLSRIEEKIIELTFQLQVLTKQKKSVIFLLRSHDKIRFQPRRRDCRK